MGVANSGYGGLPIDSIHKIHAMMKDYKHLQNEVKRLRNLLLSKDESVDIIDHDYLDLTDKGKKLLNPKILCVLEKLDKQAMEIGDGSDQ